MKRSEWCRWVRSRIGNRLPFVLIAGPCQIESRAHALEVAAALRELSGRTGVPVIYKSSYDKANRTSAVGRARRGHGARAWRSWRRCASAPACRC